MPDFLRTPQRGILCIGGPLDGQWLDYPHEAGSAFLPRSFLSLNQLPSGGLVPDDVVEIAYVRTRIRLREREVDVMLVKGLDPSDILVRLLEGYRARGQQSA